MMRGAWLALIALVVCLASTEATQRLFLGGTFSGLDGFSSRNFAQYDADAGLWQSHVADPGITIKDLDTVRGGLFVVGSFNSVENKPSQNLAFWDGIKWCPIRQGTDTPATAVWCDTDTSCWVAGTFHSIVNLQDSKTVNRFAHYVWENNEWVFDATQRGWSFLSGNLLGGDVDDGSLVVLPGATHFFVSSGGYDGTNFGNPLTIYRGSKRDNGFFVFLQANVLPGLNIIDWSIDLSVSVPVLYVITSNGTDSPMSTAKTNLALTFPCQSDPCVPPLTQPENYTQVASTAVNNTIIQNYLRIFAAPNDVRYLIAFYDPDGAGTEYQGRQRVMMQTGSGVPTLVGDAFETSVSTSFRSPVTPLSLMEDGRLLVQGSFAAANLYYPPSPLTTDSSGVVNDVRSLDLITGFAIWNGSSYVQAFGGGFGSSGHQTVRWVHDNETNQYYLLGNSIRYVYNTRADKAAWYDDDATLSIPLFPLFDRNLLVRASGGPQDGSVYSIVCDTSACTDVFVGGIFSFHGPASVSAVANVAVQRGTPTVVTEVGGGLYQLRAGFYDPDVHFQSTSGAVYALERQGDFLYAGGNFQRGGPTTSTVCLNNIARIDVSSAAASTASWEDLNGGCNDEVYDVAFFDGLLFAAGAFKSCGSLHVGFVAAYDYQASSSWSSLRVGLDGTAFSLEVFQERLIVGGEFSNAGGLPVSGVASWDGSKWRALLPACTDDCVGTQAFYFDNLASPVGAVDLHADPSGEFLWARVAFAVAKRAGPGKVFLGRWEYTDGDLGQWTVKGDQLNFNSGFQTLGDSVAFLSSDVVVVAGQQSSSQVNNVNGHVSPYNTQLDNWYGGFRTQSEVFVLAEGVPGSASSLSSPLAFFLAFF